MFTNRLFYNFLFLLIYEHKSKHLGIFLLSVIIVFLVSATMFVKDGIESKILIALKNQPDLIVQRVSSGKSADTPLVWMDDLYQIKGVESIVPRVYGRYWYEPYDTYFTIVGVDFLDKQNQKLMKKLISDFDIKEFMQKDSMIISSSVKKYFDSLKYEDYYNFRPPDRSILRVYFYKTLPKDVNFFGNDVIVTDIALAKRILGIDKDYATDLAFKISAADEELSYIINKIIVKHFNSIIIQRDDLIASYKNLFNYKGGFFLVMFLLLLATYLFILYQRYVLINQSDKKEIGILKAIGWNIKQIILLKSLEGLVVAVIAFCLGVVLAYIYVFIFQAPLFIDIFLGFNNKILLDVEFEPIVNIDTIVMLFMLFIIPYISVILLPVWKISSKSVVESFR